MSADPLLHPLHPPPALPRRRHPWARVPVAAAAWWACATAAQPVPPAPPASAPPLEIEADRIDSQIDRDAVATGNVRVRRGSLLLRADRLTYSPALDRATASGEVRVERGGDVFTGRELSLDLAREQGEILQPTYWFARTQAGGQAYRIELLDRSRTRAFKATYSSCPADGSGGPDWLLSADRVSIDIDRNEGIAEGAVLRFLGLPLLGLPVLSFPVTDERKSGWLPPSVSLDSRSGFEVSAPYYWNIAPSYDATLAPIVATRRGVGGTGEFRYLRPADRGQLNLHLLPNDRVADRSRHSAAFQHDGQAFDGLRYSALVQRASDDAYWKDFPRYLPSLTPRLLPLDLRAEYTLGRDERDPWGRYTLYARAQGWQVLQDRDPLAEITPPYQRMPQLGVRGRGLLAGAVEWSGEAEFNRFDLPSAPAAVTAGLAGGDRVHLLGRVERRFGDVGWWFTPRMAVNVASYGARPGVSSSASRMIPTLSLDGGLSLEKRVNYFGRDLVQLLEPRVLYVNTPFRDQTRLPNYDAGAKDLNLVSIFSDNVFSGVDRQSDAHQVTAGATTRFLDVRSGTELLRLGIAQRYLFRDQRITPDGVVLRQRFSDILFGGSSRLSSKWVLDGTLQYSPEIARTTRSVLSARYNPGPFRTLAASYRLSRDQTIQDTPGRILNEQVDLGWQWPVYRGAPTSGSRCAGTLYAVGRLDYSLRDSRITDSLAGVEYDAGCWILRLVARRQSTGRSEATNSLLLQLELVGLSRLGANPLQVLKDNISGYRLLREDAAGSPSAAPPGASAAPALP